MPEDFNPQPHHCEALRPLTVRFLIRTLFLKYILSFSFNSTIFYNIKRYYKSCVNRTQLRGRCCARLGVRFFAMMHSGSEENTLRDITGDFSGMDQTRPKCVSVLYRPCIIIIIMFVKG